MPTYKIQKATVSNTFQQQTMVEASYVCRYLFFVLIVFAPLAFQAEHILQHNDVCAVCCCLLSWRFSPSICYNITTVTLFFLNGVPSPILMLDWTIRACIAVNSYLAFHRRSLCLADMSAVNSYLAFHRRSKQVLGNPCALHHGAQKQARW